MFQFLERIRRKGEKERKAIALSVAAAVTAVIFLVWLSIIISGDRFSNENNIAEDLNGGLTIFRKLRVSSHKFWKKRGEAWRTSVRNYRMSKMLLELKIPFNPWVFMV